MLNCFRKCARFIFNSFGMFNQQSTKSTASNKLTLKSAASLKTRFLARCAATVGITFILWIAWRTFVDDKNGAIGRFFGDERIRQCLLGVDKRFEEKLGEMEATTRKVERAKLVCYNDDNAPEINIAEARMKKYIAVSLSSPYACGGLGNELYRFFSLYGIGKPAGRVPIMFTLCNNEKEIQQAYPVFYQMHKNYSQIFGPNSTHSAENTDYWRHFGGENKTSDCCHFFDPKDLPWSEAKKQSVIIGGNYLQHYRYFHAYRNDVLDILKCSKSLCQRVQNYSDQIFGNDTNHKLCAHSRRGDFVRLGFASDTIFSEKALDFIGTNAKKLLFNSSNWMRKNVIDKNVSVVLFGDDREFLRSLSINKSLFSNVYIPKLEQRTEDQCFARLLCDSLLITAPTSTFAWWMAYLLPEGTPIFFDANLTRLPYNADGYLRAWTPLVLTPNTSAGNSVEVKVQNDFFATLKDQ